MTTLVLGGPGTGKTTRLLSIVQDHLRAGVSPLRIAYLAFTRKAAHEARTRAMETFGFAAEELPFFRTIHSFAFARLGLSVEEVMKTADYRALGEVLGEVLAVEIDEDTSAPVGHKLVFLDHLARATGQGLRSLCAVEKENPWRALHYAEALVAYKKGRYLTDYTDMLERIAAGEGDMPALDVVVVDEAQDLTKLQWRVIDRITRDVPTVYIGGDDWQAIYQWAGADVQTFLKIQGERIVLAESHRCAAAVHEVAAMIGNRIRQKIPKAWSPKSDGGRIVKVSEPEMVDPADGTWLFLARHRYMLGRYTKYLRTKGYPYIASGNSSIDIPQVRAVVQWERLRRGDQISGTEVENVYGHMQIGMISRGHRKPKVVPREMYGLGDLKTRHGLLTDQDWMVSLNLTPENREYVRSIRARGESLTKTPRINISTIHGAKGGEADSVVLSTDLSNKAYAEYRKDHDTEDRCFFVGASRAKQNLYLVQPFQERHYRV